MKTAKTVEMLLTNKGREVWSIAPGATVFEAIEMMNERHVGALPVVEGGKLVGILSERDYARKVILKGRSSRECKVEEIMTRDVICVDAVRKIEECMAVMTQKKIRHLPVMEDGKMVGIVSIGDLVKAIIEEQQFLIEQLENYITG
jgi:CBS domain-containing protein